MESGEKGCHKKAGLADPSSLPNQIGRLAYLEGVAAVVVLAAVFFACFLCFFTFFLVVSVAGLLASALGAWAAKAAEPTIMAMPSIRADSFFMFVPPEACIMASIGKTLRVLYATLMGR